MSKRAAWLSVLRAYVALSVPLHLFWEGAQLPLYTIWTNGSAWQKTLAVVHCTGGDVVIATLSLMGALLIAGSPERPWEGRGRVIAIALMIGVAYTIYSEWLNTELRRSWSYSPLMPVLPWLGTGLAPLLQWILVPALALGTVLRQTK